MGELSRSKLVFLGDRNYYQEIESVIFHEIESFYKMLHNYSGSLFFLLLNLAQPNPLGPLVPLSLLKFYV
jgi:hypothetical protein